MEAKKILSAHLLDIVFEGRNKEYGAYYLRATYPQRIKRSMLFVFALVFMVFSGIAFANSFTTKEIARPVITEVTLTEIEQEIKEAEPIPEPERQPEQQQVRTQQFTPPVITDDHEVVEPPPTTNDFDSARIDTKTHTGIVDQLIADVPPPDEGKKIFEVQKDFDPNEVRSIVQVKASYDGNWAKFLLANLRPEVPVDNGAPAGRYTVMIQFIVDLEGKVSDLKPLTAHGYGMEEEAIRVLKKSKAWNPGIFDGREVKSYHRQPVTFEVVAE